MRIGCCTDVGTVRVVRMGIGDVLRLDELPVIVNCNSRHVGIGGRGMMRSVLVGGVRLGRLAAHVIVSVAHLVLRSTSPLC